MPASNILRKEWPKIRAISVKGERFYQVDARRQGTAYKRQAFGKIEDAEARVADILAEIADAKTEKKKYEKAGADLPKRTRAQAVESEALLAKLENGATILDAVRAYVESTAVLAKYGKRLTDATAFYVAFLEDEAKKSSSTQVKQLAEAWYGFKEKKHKEGTLRKDTLDGILETKKLLEKAFGTKRILEITEQDIQDYLDGMTEAGAQRKFNVRSLFSQFFNWAIKEKHTTLNPCSGIEIELPAKDISILTVEECKHLMKVCEDKHKDLTLYTAICLFAGLRPTECKLLKWEQIHLEEKQITVLHGTTKVKETRNVPIEENLMQWLHNYKGERKGLVTPHTKANLRPRLERLRVDAGYKLLGENPDGKVWVEDVLRHTYASYWLGRTKDRSHLAENMGTSLKMIKKHYKQVVSASSTAAFWAITPTAKR